MALGIRTESAPLDLIPIVKYDARAGRIARVDRSNDGSGWATSNEDITANFKAVFDLENVEIGWMNFASGGAPDFRMVALGNDPGGRPSDGHKEGFRIMMKLSKECGGDVRELCSTAKAVIGAFDELHDAYLKEADANPGKLPVIAMTGARAIQTNAPNGSKTTNYAPVFKIEAWVPRPADLVFKPKSPAKTAAPSAAAKTSPATGSTRAAPPPAASAQADAANDFG